MANTTKHLTRRLALASPLLRTIHTAAPRALFSTTATPLQGQSANSSPPPALSDIDSKGVDAFYARQEDFRTRMAAAKDQADS